MSNSPTNTNSMKRPPVVVVMGHVDHGKTSLLDYIRKANVAAREAGGITQAVAAYEIVHGNEKITFIDTPGHEAFSAMRSRGARIADLAIVVVAADEGIKPQTLEAITILTESKTPFVIAMNKVDREGANVEKLKNDFTAAGIYLEGYGGQISYQAISAKTGEGVSELLDLVLLTAEVEHLTYDPTAPATGFVLEVRHSKMRGLEVSLIVKNGTLAFGSVIGTASGTGKIKMLEDFTGKNAKHLVPSSPALVVGFESAPLVGEEFTCDAAMVEEYKASAHQTRQLAREAVSAPSALELLAMREKPQQFAVILKASDAGSLEALQQIIGALSLEKEIRIVASSIGDVVDADVKFATSTGAVIVGFKVKVGKSVELLAQNSHVQVLQSDVVYTLVQQLEALVSAGPVADAVGELTVLAVFNQKRFDKQLVGGVIAKGMFRNKGNLAIYRGDEQVATGKIVSLRDVKKDIISAEAPKEVGVVIDAKVKIEVGDRLVLL